jgi:hypothetical protein
LFRLFGATLDLAMTPSNKANIHEGEPHIQRWVGVHKKQFQEIACKCSQKKAARQQQTNTITTTTKHWRKLTRTDGVVLAAIFVLASPWPGLRL